MPATTLEIPQFPMARRHPLDPPPQYRELGAKQRVFRVRTPRDEEVWVVSHHDDARAVLSDRRFSSDPRTPGFPTYVTGDVPPPPGFFLQQDPPDHSRLRRSVTREFVTNRMQALRPDMQRLLDELIDAMTAAGTSGDLVAELAYPMASGVICDLLGVPFEDHTTFVSLTDTVLDRSSSPEASERAAMELMAYFDGLVTAKEREPADDVFGRMVTQASDGAKTSHAELVGLAALLLLSGYDTMAQMIGLGVLTLLEHPAQLDELRRRPSLYPRAVEELLRFLSINHSGLPRAATADVTIGGRQIRAGDGVIVMLNEANRDEQAFERPDAFDIHRPLTPRHVAFGHGFHKCIGLALARVELATVFEGLFARLPGLRLARPLEELRFRDDMVLYGVRELPVQW